MTCWRPSCADRRPARDVLVAPQDECGRVVDVHVHTVGRDRTAAAERRLAGVGVDVEAREVAGGDVQPYAVPGREEVRRVRCRDLDLLHLPGYEGLRLRERLAEAASEDAFCEVHR